MRCFDTLSVEHDPFIDARWQSLQISGTVSADKLRAIAYDIIPNLHEIASEPGFVDDLQGCVQLIFLVCLSAKLHWGGGRLIE
jgi:hypothetical protein